MGVMMGGFPGSVEGLSEGWKGKLPRLFIMCAMAHLRFAKARIRKNTAHSWAVA